MSKRLRIMMNAAMEGSPPDIVSGFTFSHFDKELLSATLADADPSVAIEVAIALGMPELVKH